MQWGVGLLDAQKGVLERLADIVGFGEYVIPVAAKGHLDSMEDLFPRQLSTTDLGQYILKLFVVDIADPFKKQDRKDVGLVVGCIDGAGDDVRGVP